jgi:hypothetical protein
MEIHFKVVKKGVITAALFFYEIHISSSEQRADILRPD